MQHLFTKFTCDGLYCCLATEGEPCTIRLYLAVKKYTLDQWAKHDPKDPPPEDLNEREAFEQRFSVEEGQKVRKILKKTKLTSICGRKCIQSALKELNSSFRNTFKHSEIHAQTRFNVLAIEKQTHQKEKIKPELK